MKLVLAEKPSVAMSLSKVIGADQRGDGYMEGNGYLVSWCVGHLVELSQPEAYDEKYAKWKYDELPILPEHWQYQVSASTKKQKSLVRDFTMFALPVALRRRNWRFAWAWQASSMSAAWRTVNAAALLTC